MNKAYFNIIHGSWNRTLSSIHNQCGNISAADICMCINFRTILFFFLCFNFWGFEVLLFSHVHATFMWQYCACFRQAKSEKVILQLAQTNQEKPSYSYRNEIKQKIIRFYGALNILAFTKIHFIAEINILKDVTLANVNRAIIDSK